MRTFQIQGNYELREILLAALFIGVVLAFLGFGDTTSLLVIDMVMLGGCGAALILILLLARPARWLGDPEKRELRRIDLAGLRRLVFRADDVTALELHPKRGGREHRLLLQRRRASPLVVRTSRDVLHLRRDGRLLAETLGVPLRQPVPGSGQLSSEPRYFWLEPGVPRKPTEVEGFRVLEDLARRGRLWSFSVPSGPEGSGRHGFVVSETEITYKAPSGEEHAFAVDDIDDIASVLRGTPEDSYLAILTHSGMVRLRGMPFGPLEKGGKPCQTLVVDILLASLRDLNPHPDP